MVEIGLWYFLDYIFKNFAWKPTSQFVLLDIILPADQIKLREKVSFLLFLLFKKNFKKVYVAILLNFF